jgi:hypothetical protein
VQFELKTTTVAGTGVHDVLVDLGQLWEYRQRPIGHQPFYAFPWPDWRGDLTAAAIAGGRPVTELAFGRSGPGWWFADWMVVLTSAQVARVLRRELAAHGGPSRGVKRRLVRFDLRRSLNNPEVKWGSDATPAAVVRWLDFWPELEQCGRDGWPQLIRIPARFARTQDVYSRSQLAGLLREAAHMIARSGWEDDELATLAPREDGTYQVLNDSVRGLGELRAGGSNEEDGHRQVVFLEARALFRGEYRRFHPKAGA